MEQQLTTFLLPVSPKGAKTDQTFDDSSSLPSTSTSTETQTQNHRSFFKFFLYFFLVALAYYFIVSAFTLSPLSPPSPESSPGNVAAAVAVAGNCSSLKRRKLMQPQEIDTNAGCVVHSADAAAIKVSAKKCDLFTGDWIPDPSGPLYTNHTCPHIQDFQNCLFNGRPDVNYLFWRWKPRDCDLPRFTPSQFLDTMKNKWLAFIGDSIARNHVQSLICILSQVVAVEEIYHDKEFRSKIWRFPSHNFTLSVIWSPLLVKSDTSNSSAIQLYLDQLDHKWTVQYPKFDYVVISGGKWFLKSTIFYENNSITGCHYCQGRDNLTDFGYDYPYRKALNLLRDFVLSSTHKPFVLFRTTTPDHFEIGEWNTGGYCNRTMPFKGEEAKPKTVDDVMRDVELDVFQKFRKGSGLDSNIRVLNTTGMSLLRPDGHPGPYRHPNPLAGGKKINHVQNDCLHWCLPGPIDAWNDVMVEIILNEERYW